MVGGVAGLAAFLLASCGGETTPTAAPATGGGASTAPSTAASSAPTAAASARPSASTAASAAPSATAARATASAAGGSGTAVSTGTGVLAPKTGADIFKGKELNYFQKVQYYKAVQDQIGNAIKAYATSTGGTVNLAIASTDGAQNIAKIQAGVQAGSPFDLGDDIGTGIGQLITLNLLEDVTDLVTQLTGAYGAVMPIVPPGLTKDGKYYAIPFFTSSDAWFARKDKLAAKGIDPKSLDTYEKVRDAALAISDPSNNFFGWGFSPYAVGDGPQLISHVVNSYGGSIQDKTGTKVVFNSPETIAGITFLSDIYTNPKYKGMLPTGYESWDGAGNNTAWLNGIVGFTANAFTLYAKAKDDKNPVFENTYVLTRPKGPGVKTALTGGQLGYLAIYRGAKNIDMAKETAKYLLQPEQWNKIATQGGGLILPAYEAHWKNDYWKSDPNFAQLETQVRDASGYNQTYYPGPSNPALDAAVSGKVLETMMASIIQQGQKVQDAVKEANDQMVKIYEQFGFKQ
jgi:multiple sugar transport system substrate-binding protein